METQGKGDRGAEREERLYLLDGPKVEMARKPLGFS